MLICTVGCSDSKNQNNHNDMTESSEGISQTDKEPKKGEDGAVVKDEELVKELVELAYASLDVQNSKGRDDLEKIYTKKFIEKIIKKDDDFYKRNVRTVQIGESPYPLVLYRKNNTYEVNLHVMDDSMDSAYFVVIMVKRDNHHKFKIFDIYYDA